MTIITSFKLRPGVATFAEFQLIRSLDGNGVRETIGYPGWWHFRVTDQEVLSKLPDICFVDVTRGESKEKALVESKVSNVHVAGLEVMDWRETEEKPKIGDVKIVSGPKMTGNLHPITHPVKDAEPKVGDGRPLSEMNAEEVLGAIAEAQEEVNSKAREASLALLRVCYYCGKSVLVGEGERDADMRLKHADSRKCLED